MSDASNQPTRSRTFTYRAVLIAILCSVLLAMWIHFHKVLVPQTVELAENSPPTPAVAILLGVLLVIAALQFFSRKLMLSRGELLVIYIVLIIAAPLMTQGMWHRFLGLMIGIPNTTTYSALLDSYSDKLWPHGEHLIGDRTFEDELGALAEQITTEPSEATGAGVRIFTNHPDRVSVVEVENSRVGRTRAIRIQNPRPPPLQEGQTADEIEQPLTRVHLRVPRYDEAGYEQLVPGERYFLAALVHLADMRGRSYLEIGLQPPDPAAELVQPLRLNKDTREMYSQPGGFKRLHEPVISLPREMQADDDHLDLVIELEGQGTATVTDLWFFNNEAIQRMLKGSSEVARSDLDKLAANERDSLLVRPDDLGTIEGIWYKLKGYVPYSQWVKPLLYWVVIVLAIFLCLLAIAVIFRRQWGDNERFNFPLIVVPRLLLEQREKNGRIIRPVFRKPAFLIGVGLALVYSLQLGFAYYIPGMPSLQEAVQVNVQEYFESPALRKMFSGYGGWTFKPQILIIAIAFFIDLHLLASVLLFFVIVHIPYALGEAFGWEQTIPAGPSGFRFPFSHHQHIGAFLALALMVFWVSRRHLAAVWRTALGREGGLDDSGEAMRYRTALITIVVCFVVFGVWGAMTGMGAVSSLIFFGFIVLCGLAAARIRTEFGAPWAYFTPYFPYLIFFVIGGLGVFTLQTMVLVFLAGGFMAVAQFLMFAPSQVEMMQLGREVEARPGGVKWGLILGLLVGVLLGGYVLLVWYYGQGGENVPYTWPINQSWVFGSLSGAVQDMDTASLAAGAEQADAVNRRLAPSIAVGIGAAVTVGLTLLRQMFAGFWLHPIGYVLANTFFIYMIWGSLLVALVVKWLALKIGGPRLVREQMTPLFVGLFCGGVAGVAIWDIVALILMSQGQSGVVVILP